MVLTATATEIQNSFGKYLACVLNGDEILIRKNGKEVARMIPRDAAVSFLTDSLTGILKTEYDLEDAKRESLEKKYAPAP